MNDDQELLRAFAEEKSQAAFAALVQRHLPMIYAAAHRQTGDAHRAEEIAQAAFTLLARKAPSLKKHPALGGWLYTTTGHLAARLRRTEARRIRREQEAHAMHEANTPPGEMTGESLRPMVDEIILALPERDRLAVLLRFFEDRPYAEIGRRLGLTENAARMRVDRAVEQLRTRLAQRGIVSTAAALGAALGANATLTPPAGLVAGIAAGAATAAARGGLLFLMKASILKTGIVTSILVLATAGLLWQRHANRRVHAELARPEAPTPRPPLAPTVAPAPPKSGFARLSGEVAALQNSPADSGEERAGVLQELMAQFPEFQIPELGLATPEDWLEATKEPLTTDADYRRALAQVRATVVLRFNQQVNGALQVYLQQHAGKFPEAPAQLEAYFANPLGPEIWTRYKIMSGGFASPLKLGADPVLTLKAPVDGDYDLHLVMDAQGLRSTPFRTIVIEPVFDAYHAAHPGQEPASVTELLPYAKTNVQRSAIRAAMEGK